MPTRLMAYDAATKTSPMSPISAISPFATSRPFSTLCRRCIVVTRRSLPAALGRCAELCIFIQDKLSSSAREEIHSVQFEEEIDEGNSNERVDG